MKLLRYSIRSLGLSLPNHTSLDPANCRRFFSPDSFSGLLCERDTQMFLVGTVAEPQACVYLHLYAFVHK